MASRTELESKGFIFPEANIDQIKAWPAGILNNALKTAEMIEAGDRQAVASAAATTSAVANRVTSLEEGSAVTAATVARALGYALVVSDREPPKHLYGVPVLWVDTADIDAYIPPAPVVSRTTYQYTIPEDRGVTYTVNGAPKAAGTYTVPEPYPATITITATAKPGFTLSPAARTTWEIEYALIPIAYDDAAEKEGGAQIYWRLDEPAGTKYPRNRGTGAAPLHQNFALGGLGAPSLGIGTTAATTEGNYWLSDPGGYPAWTVATVAYSHSANAFPNLYLFRPWGNTPTVRFQPDPWNPTTKLNVTITPATGSSTTKAVEMPLARKLHYAATWDGAKITAYINGNPVHTLATTEAIASSAALRVVAHLSVHQQIAGVVCDLSQAKSAAYIKALAQAAGL